MAAAARATHALMSSAARDAAPTGNQLVERIETALAGSGAQGDGDPGVPPLQETVASNLNNALQILRSTRQLLAEAHESILPHPYDLIVEAEPNLEAVERRIVNALELLRQGGRS